MSARVIREGTTMSHSGLDEIKRLQGICKKQAAAILELVNAMEAVADRADEDLKNHFKGRTSECERQYGLFMRLIKKYKS